MKSRRTQAILLMTAAMLAIPVVDALAKHLSAAYSPLFIGWARYFVACLVVLPLAGVVRGVRLFPAEGLSSHVLRTASLVGAMTLYFMALARVPLATAAAASFVGPVVAVGLAVVFLKERLTGRKVVSLFLAFGGALIILRPGGAMEPGVLLALGAGVAFAFYIVATRQAAQQSDPVKTLAFQCAVGALMLTPQAALSWSTPAWDDALSFAGLGLVSAASHLLSITAFRLAEASMLAPLVYVELIGAGLLGYLVFREVPDAATALGAVLIVGAGLTLVAGGRAK
jgi:drug/metabolite transporter (DMT)-like permease